MKPRKPWKLLAVSLLPFTLVAALLGRPRATNQKAGEVPVSILQGHRLPVQALAFSPDGTALASAAYYFNAPGSGTEVVAWDVATGSLQARRTEPLTSLFCLAFAAGGRRLAAAEFVSPGR